MFSKHSTACASASSGTLSSGDTPSWPEANTMRPGAATSTAWLYCANGARIEAGLSGRFMKGLPVCA